MKITKVMLESMVRQELKKVLKEAQIPPHVKDPRGSGKIYLKSDVDSLYAGLVEDVKMSINIQQYSAGRAKGYASALKRGILQQVAEGVAKASVPPSDILMEAGEFVAEHYYPAVMTNQEQIYDDVLGQLAELSEKYNQMEQGFEKEEMEYDDEDDYHDELGPDATEDDFY
jgi:hypothetical protein